MTLRPPNHRRVAPTASSRASDSLTQSASSPLSRGGRNDLSNLVATCRPCNSDKRDLTLSEWAEDRARRNATPVQTVFDIADPRYRHPTTRSELRLAA
ncbi:HNH endonuclease [Microbacterium sp. E-13]|uniref:HNH endonuclease n=1 Tax=Microbacterium sp. E-13 TaxID=3404048 RepID=UPI003CF0A819